MLSCYHIRKRGLGTILAVIGALGIASPLSFAQASTAARSVQILYPFDGSLFPADIRSPEIRWADDDPEHRMWRIRLSFRKKSNDAVVLTKENRWTPSQDAWARIKKASLETPALLEVCGVKSADAAPEVCAHIQFMTSKDAVGVPIFYRAVPNPMPGPSGFGKIKWKLGWVSSYDPPIVVMQNQSRCFNCHAASFNGKVFGFEFNHRIFGDKPADRGGYVVFKDPGKKVVWHESDYFNWNSVLPAAERQTTSGTMSAISPDGRFIVSGFRLDDIAFFSPLKDQIGYDVTTRGSLAYYSFKDKSVRELPGADDGRYMRIASAWSPDGEFIFFSREPLTPQPQIKEWRRMAKDPQIQAAQSKMGWKDLDKTYPQLYDIYRIPFNNGRGGRETPVEGASRNGQSNYFPKISPDGKWMVFTQSASGMLMMRADSELWIVPANGGTARKLGSNGPGANSWHSWSPNSRWLVFSSKAYDGSPRAFDGSPTDLALTHIDANGNDSPRLILTQMRDGEGLSANLPEFFNIKPGQLEEIDSGELGGYQP